MYVIYIPSFVDFIKVKIFNRKKKKDWMVLVSAHASHVVKKKKFNKLGTDET